MSSIVDLRSKIKLLSESVWERRALGLDLDKWLQNYRALAGSLEREREHALFLLSNFLYFGDRQMRELLKALYRDLYKYPIVEAIRRAHNDTMDSELINSEFRNALRGTRFLGIGNPSESGSHLLYYFRQENRLPKELFINSHEIFEPGSSMRRLSRPNVANFIFIDDFVGGGTQAERYSKSVIVNLKEIAPSTRVSYLTLFATTSGLTHIRTQTAFDKAACIFELDSSFRCFDKRSRYFVNAPDGIEQDFAEKMCATYGQQLYPEHPCGHGGCQLLIGFHHNIPNNTLPVIWSDGFGQLAWTPIFRRYPKVYGWGQT